jgi:hypothetical protein
MIPVKPSLDPASFNKRSNRGTHVPVTIQSYFGNFIIFESKFMMKADTVTR